MKHRQKGSQSLEFTMILIPFLILMLGFFEISRLLLINSLFESAVSAGAREVRSLPKGFRSEQAFANKIGQFPLIDVHNLSISTSLYGKTLQDIAHSTSVSRQEAKLAEYQITYKYTFTFLPSLSDTFSDSIGSLTTLKRRVLVSYDNK